MIHLKRSITVRTFEIEATVAVGRERPEFLAVARLAADLARPINGRDIARELLGNLPEQVGWRVLERTISLGLLKREGPRGSVTLSESGRTMLERNKVLVPEEGVWRFYMVEDYLVSSSLIHVQRLNADHAKAERDRLYKRDRRAKLMPGRRPPQVLTSEDPLLFWSVTNGSGFEIRDLGERGEEGPSGEIVVSMQWEAGKAPKVWLRGQLPETPEPVDMVLPIADGLKSLSYDDVWLAMVSSATGVNEEQLIEWHQRAGALVLPTNMDQWPSAAVRRSFMTELQVPSVWVPDIGEFDPTSLQGIPLVAESEDAAQQWGEWLLWDNISAYVVPADIERIRQDVRGKFPLHRPKLPDDNALLQRALSTPQDQTARFILAPVDLGLWSSTR